MSTCALIATNKVDTVASVLARIATTFVHVRLAMFSCPTLVLFFMYGNEVEKEADRSEIIIKKTFWTEAMIG